MESIGKTEICRYRLQSLQRSGGRHFGPFCLRRFDAVQECASQVGRVGFAV